MTRTQRLRKMWAEINRDWFARKLTLVPIHVTRSRCTYGYFAVTESSKKPSMRVSVVLADTDQLVYDTLKHEMIHQALWEEGRKDWHDHGEAFQTHHERIFGHRYVEEN